MSKDGRIKTTYIYDEAVYEPHVQVLDKKTDKSFYIIYKDNYLLGKALNKIRRGKSFLVLSHNYKLY